MRMRLKVDFIRWINFFSLAKVEKKLTYLLPFLNLELTIHYLVIISNLESNIQKCTLFLFIIENACG